MSDQSEVTPTTTAATECPPHIDWVASQFHEVYEQIAIALGYETRRDSAVPWEDVPDLNKNLMRQTVARLLTRDVISYGGVTLRRYLPTGG